MDIAIWLRELGLERYEQAFRENEIDAEILPKLTADDLKDIGVTIVGHRRKLLEAIAALAKPALGPEIELMTAAGPVARARLAEAERRQLTVMFVDLVGSTALSAKLDPEDMRAVITAYQECCTAVIERFEGNVAKYMGDGVLAYFGYPRAHEDDAERAVRAGLELAAAVGTVATSVDAQLAARVGIATGLVVVGDLVGEGVAQEQAVVGDTPNLASRLQGLAEPGSVVIAEPTRRLIGGLFELVDLGSHRLKGFDADERAWRALGDSRAESRFAARSATGLTPFVGRQHEVGMLLDRFERAKDGEGQVVLLSGEPGIGKSRLAHDLIENLIDEPHARLRFYCSPYHVNSALHPVIKHLERAAGLLAYDSPERKLDKLEALLGQGSNAPRQVAPLFAALLSVPVEARYPPLDLSAQRQRELTIGAMVDQMSGLTAHRPVLMILEDAHWIDPTTTELFERVIERAQTLPVLLLITFRPEFAPPWTSYPHMTSLTLNRLGRRHSSEMVAAVAGGKPLPDDVLAQIWAKTEGVPLFVEELTKTVLESGLLEDRGDHYELIGPLPPLAIPATLQDSLMARLDRLAPVKEIAQIGAVIGREFSYGLLGAVSPLDETALQDALSHLVGSELVFRRGTIPNATYSFKHAFVQDAAYASLLRSKRQQLHAAVAGALVEQVPDLADSQPEILAHHLTEAGLTDEAIDYWQRAGQRAAERSASIEAAAHFGRGLALLGALPASSDRDQRELALLTALGSMVISTKGHPSIEVATVYGRARELCRSIGDTPHLAPVLQGLRLHHMVRGELQPARDAAEELLALGQRSRDVGHCLEGHRAVGVMRYLEGNFRAALHHLDEAIDLYDPERHGAHVLLYEHDPGMTCLGYAALTRWLLGYPDQAVVLSDRALEVAEATSHTSSLVEAMTWRTQVALSRRDLQDARDRAAATLALATGQALPLWTAAATSMHGWLLSEQGQEADGIAQIREALAILAKIEDRMFRPYELALLARAHLKSAQPDEGLLAIAEAIDSARATGLVYWDAELHRLKGQLLLARDGSNSDVVESCFHHAVETAQRQGAKSLELRAATSLGRLWGERGRYAEAHDLLASVYGWFTEGFDTADLKDAKALLDDLS